MLVTASGLRVSTSLLEDACARGAGSTRSPHKAPICASVRHASHHNRTLPQVWRSPLSAAANAAPLCGPAFRHPDGTVGEIEKIFGSNA